MTAFGPASEPPFRAVILTADDFGLDPAVNEAVEIGYRQGVLTAASLMVAEPAAADAARRARELPGLAVGLHLSLTHGRSLLPPEAIPHLVDRRGRLSSALVAQALIWCLPQARQELAREVEAQFQAYLALGLPLDHVSVHQHMHLHPVLGALVVEAAQRHGVASVRLPQEPEGTERLLGVAPRRLERWVSGPWLRHLARTLRRAGLYHADRVYGLSGSGQMDEARLLTLLRQLPPGLSEIYLHPATRPTPNLATSQPGYRGPAELAALTSPSVRRLLEAGGIRRTTYGAQALNPSA